MVYYYNCGIYYYNCGIGKFENDSCKIWLNNSIIVQSYKMNKQSQQVTHHSQVGHDYMTIMLLSHRFQIGRCSPRNDRKMI